MIETEIFVFVVLFAVGLGAGVLASFFLALGTGSRVARAIFDFLTPIAAGAIFFFALRASANGVFRVYSVVAFLVGMFVAGRIVGRIAPRLSRLVLRAKVPIKSLEKKVDEAWERRLAPLRERRAAKKAARAEKRALARLAAKEKKEQKARKKKRAQEEKSTARTRDPLIID